MTPSAVTQQIQLLEMQLGTSLMVKVGRRIALTEAGERYFTSIRDQVERRSLAEARGHLDVVVRDLAELMQQP